MLFFCLLGPLSFTCFGFHLEFNLSRKDLDHQLQMVLVGFPPSWNPFLDHFTKTGFWSGSLVQYSQVPLFYFNSSQDRWILCDQTVSPHSNRHTLSLLNRSQPSSLSIPLIQAQVDTLACLLSSLKSIQASLSISHFNSLIKPSSALTPSSPLLNLDCKLDLYSLILLIQFLAFMCVALSWASLWLMSLRHLTLVQWLATQFDYLLSISLPFPPPLTFCFSDSHLLTLISPHLPSSGYFSGSHILQTLTFDPSSDWQFGLD